MASKCDNSLQIATKAITYQCSTSFIFSTLAEYSQFMYSQGVLYLLQSYIHVSSRNDKYTIDEIKAIFVIAAVNYPIVEYGTFSLPLSEKWRAANLSRGALEIMQN